MKNIRRERGERSGREGAERNLLSRGDVCREERKWKMERNFSLSATVCLAERGGMMILT